MSNQYLDYELDLGAAIAACTWPVTVLQSPAGQARGMLTLPLDPAQIAQAAQRASPQEAQDLGRMLFERMLLGSGIYGTYAESMGAADAQDKGLRVKLRTADPQLALLPWELMYEERFGEYVALSHETPLVRYVEAAQPQPPLAVKPPLRILGMAVSPGDLPPVDVATQKQVMEAALAEPVRQGLVELTWLNGGSWRSLQQALRGGRPWHIFHFVGHGTVDPQSGEGMLALADENGAAQPLRASELGRILASHKSLRLALLNACHSAAAGAGDLYFSTAAALIRRGLPAVIAMQFAIAEEASVELARTFYAALADSLPVEAALTDARIAMSVEQPAGLDWAAPVLYLRAPDGVLFEVKKGAGEPTGQQEGTRIAVPIGIRELKGRQLQAAMDALLSAYSSEGALAQIVAVALGENLASIAGGNNLKDKVFNLLEWARAHGKLTELLQGALDGNPSNPELRGFVDSLIW